MYTLELCWPIRDGRNDFAIVVRSDDITELAAIAASADFRAWADREGCAFIEIWDDSDNLIHLERP